MRITYKLPDKANNEGNTRKMQIFITILLIVALYKWWKNYCLFVGLVNYIIENRLRTPSKEEIEKHATYVGSRLITDFFHLKPK